MAWTFVRNVDLVEDRPVNGRRVFVARAEFTDGVELRCIARLFYDTSPTVAQRLAARNEVLAQLNAPPAPRDFLEEHGDRIRERIIRALQNGKTPAQILAVILNRLEAYADE